MCAVIMARATEKISLLKELSKSWATFESLPQLSAMQLAKEQDSRGDILRVHGLHEGRRFCAGILTLTGLFTKTASEVTSFVAS